MNKTILKNMRVLALGLFVSSSLSILTGCEDDLDKGTRFTFTGKLISDHLKENPELSDFCKILSQAKIGKKSSSNIIETLSTYGSYTCFAPNNDAIAKYIEERYNAYYKSVESNKLDPDKPIINNGIKSPKLEDLSDSMATVIAMNHLIEFGYNTMDVPDGSFFPMQTMNHRDVQMNYLVGKDGTLTPILDKHATVTSADLEAENGFLHIIDGVLSPSEKPISELLADQPSFTIFSNALKLTGLDKYLTQYELDPNYDGTATGPVFSTEKSFGRTPYPKEKKQRFTLLVESNDLLADPTKNILGASIKNVEDLTKFAETFYGTEAAGDYKNPNNALYKFVAYHIIDRKLTLKIGGAGSFIMEGYFNTKKDYSSEHNMPTEHDRYDYFETLLPGSLIKVTRPFTNQSNYVYYGAEETSPFNQLTVINYAQEYGTFCSDPRMEQHINVVIEPSSVTMRRPGLENFEQDAQNGFIYTIDKILIHSNEEMKNNILNERMRWDIISLFPELTNNGVRWALDNDHVITYIPDYFSKRLERLNNDCYMFYLRPHAPGGDQHGGYPNYQGDELLVEGTYDFRYRLPHVPTGDYEIRIGSSLSDSRGIIQIYLDKKICGIPVNLRNNKENMEFIGWFDESELNEEQIKSEDKAMRNRGFMKGPASIVLHDKYTMRDNRLVLRKIIGTYRLNQNDDHWLRMRDVTDATYGTIKQFEQDFIEIVPTSITTNQKNPEDIY